MAVNVCKSSTKEPATGILLPRGGTQETPPLSEDLDTVHGGWGGGRKAFTSVV